METIKNIVDLMQSLDCSTEEEMRKYFRQLDYPVEITYSDEKVTLKTDADRVPFDKNILFPFTEDEYESAITGLLCVTDYAMHEGYDNVHKEVFESLALRHAEKIGVYQYKVNGRYMEYWSLFDEGFYFFRTDLDTLEREEVCHIPWNKNDGTPIPAFLQTDVMKSALYNYFVG